MKRFIALITCMVCLLLLPVTIHATMVDEAVEYELGHTYSGSTSLHRDIFYSIHLNEKSNVFIKIIASYYIGIEIYNETGKMVLNRDDFSYSYNNLNEKRTYECARVLPMSTYYIKLYRTDGFVYNYDFFLTAEPAISLSRPSIKSLKNSSPKTINVKASSVGNSIGYQYQYSTSKRINGGKIVEGGISNTIRGLKKGKKYYIRIRAYALYGSGNPIYSAWSLIRTITIKK